MANIYPLRNAQPPVTDQESGGVGAEIAVNAVKGGCALLPQLPAQPLVTANQEVDGGSVGLWVLLAPWAKSCQSAPGMNGPDPFRIHF